MNWNYSESWRLRGKNFLVEIYRYMPLPPDNKWAVYAYVYPGHKLFDSLKNTESLSIFDPALKPFPFHCGPSYFTKICGSDGSYMSIKVGADYDHLYDRRFNEFENLDQAREVQNDAEKLYRFLEN